MLSRRSVQGAISDKGGEGEEERGPCPAGTVVASAVVSTFTKNFSFSHSTFPAAGASGDQRSEIQVCFISELSSFALVSSRRQESNPLARTGRTRVPWRAVPSLSRRTRRTVPAGMILLYCFVASFVVKSA